MFEKYFSQINNKWFFETPAAFMKYLMVYVNGDSVVIIPFLILVLLFGFFSIDFMLILIGLFVAVRCFGEMIFWMLQQFGARTYRPHDFGLTQLDNHAVYILYQLTNMVGVVLVAGLVIMIIYY
jgi:hypothetical protein